MSLFDWLYGHFLRSIDDPNAESHDLKFNVGMRESELVFVHLIEFDAQMLKKGSGVFGIIFAEVNRECHCLTFVPHIRLVHDP